MIETETDTRPTVALLCFPQAGGLWSEGALERLSDAYSVAGKLKERVSVFVPVSDGGSVPDPEPLRKHGCSILVLLRHPDFHHRDPVQIARALTTHVQDGCRLLLCPGDPHGEAIAACLAETIESVWVPDLLTLAVTRKGAVQVNAVLPGGKLSRDYKAAGSCLVGCMKDGVAEATPLDQPPELEIHEVAAPEPLPTLRTRLERYLPADPGKVDIRFAGKIVAAGRGAGGPEGVKLLAELAEDLDASLGASRVAVDLDWVPYERQVGQTGRTVRPGLYVAAGISGASHHLLGMRDSDHIVAINTDEEAPIHEVSHLSLHGDLHEIVPKIRKLLGRNGRD